MPNDNTADDNRSVANEIERMLTLGLSGAAFAGLLTALTIDRRGDLVGWALLCFSLAMPGLITVYILNSLKKELEIDYGLPYVAVGVVGISLLLTIIGYSFLLAITDPYLGILLIAVSVLFPLLIIRIILQLSRKADVD